MDFPGFFISVYLCSSVDSEVFLIPGGDSGLLHAPGKAGPRVARPAEAGQAAPERARNLRRQKRLGIVQASSDGIVQGRVMQRQKILPALPGSAGGGVVKQIGFRGKPLQDGHRDARRFRAANVQPRLRVHGRSRRGIAAGQFPAACFPASHFPAAFALGRVVTDSFAPILDAFACAALALFFEDQLGNEYRAFQIRKRVTESLRRVHPPQRLKIIRRVFADAHEA